MRRACLNLVVSVGCEGEVLARQLASLGAKLILSARNQAELERVKSQLTGILLTVMLWIFPSIYWKLFSLFYSYFFMF